MSTTSPSVASSDDLKSINYIVSTEVIKSLESDSFSESIESTESSMSVVSLGDSVAKESDGLIDIDSEGDSNYAELPTSECFSGPFELPAPPPSWTSSVEAFVNQLNEYEYIYDSESSESFELFEFKGIGEISDSDDEETTQKLTSKFLTYLAVPVLISQILIIIILNNASNSSANAANSALPIFKPNIFAIHHYHHHHCHHFIYVSEDEDHPTGGFAKRFFHIFFNPFSVISNNNFYKKSADWFKKQANDPTSVIGQFFKYLDSYLRAIQLQLSKLDNVLRSGIDTELGEALKIRDKWTKAVYDKVYKVAETPQYKRIVSTVSKWASALKDSLLSGK